VHADLVNALKNHLDKYCINQDVVYNYKSDLIWTKGLAVTLCCLRHITSHWIGLDSTIPEIWLVPTKS